MQPLSVLWESSLLQVGLGSGLAKRPLMHDGAEDNANSSEHSRALGHILRKRRLRQRGRSAGSRPWHSNARFGGSHSWPLISRIGPCVHLHTRRICERKGAWADAPTALGTASSAQRTRVHNRAVRKYGCGQEWGTKGSILRLAFSDCSMIGAWSMLARLYVSPGGQYRSLSASHKKRLAK